MSELVIYADEDEAWWRTNSSSTSATSDIAWPIARAATDTIIGVGLPYLSSGNYSSLVGNQSVHLYYPSLSLDYYLVYMGQSSLVFATSSIPAGSEVDSVVLSIYGLDPGVGWTQDFDFTIEARKIDGGYPSPFYTGWTAGLAQTVPIEDYYLPGDELASKDLLATFDTSGYSTSGYNAFTSESNFKDLIELYDDTSILLCSNDSTDNTNPFSSTTTIPAESNGSEYSSIYFTARYEADGDTTDPKLVIQYTAAVANQQELCAHF